jgi:hypothetical protein
MLPLHMFIMRKWIIPYMKYKSLVQLLAVHCLSLSITTQNSYLTWVEAVFHNKFSYSPPLSLLRFFFCRCSSVQRGETCWSHCNWLGDTRGSQAVGPTMDTRNLFNFTVCSNRNMSMCTLRLFVREMCVWNKTVCRKKCVTSVVNHFNSRHLYAVCCHCRIKLWNLQYIK